MVVTIQLASPPVALPCLLAIQLSVPVSVVASSYDSVKMCVCVCVCVCDSVCSCMQGFLPEIQSEACSLEFVKGLQLTERMVE